MPGSSGGVVQQLQEVPVDSLEPPINTPSRGRLAARAAVVAAARGSKRSVGGIIDVLGRQPHTQAVPRGKQRHPPGDGGLTEIAAMAPTATADGG